MKNDKVEAVAIELAEYLDIDVNSAVDTVVEYLGW